MYKQQLEASALSQSGQPLHGLAGQGPSQAMQEFHYHGLPTNAAPTSPKPPQAPSHHGAQALLRPPTGANALADGAASSGGDGGGGNGGGTGSNGSGGLLTSRAATPRQPPRPQGPLADVLPPGKCASLPREYCLLNLLCSCDKQENFKLQQYI